MLISPTEPAEFRVLGDVSSVPELYGADFLMFGPKVGRVGVQRKEINDFVASIRDDRLAKEVSQLKSLNVAMLILEGRVEFTNDGGSLLSTRSPLSRAQFLGTLWMLQASGLWITYTNSSTDTIECLSLFSRWIAKEKHTSLLTRSSPRNMYGTRGSEDWQIHILQGFPGLGYERARSVREFYGGLPLAWTGTLSDVPGIGAKMWARLQGML